MVMAKENILMTSLIEIFWIFIICCCYKCSRTTAVDVSNIINNYAENETKIIVHNFTTSFFASEKLNKTLSDVNENATFSLTKVDILKNTPPSDFDALTNFSLNDTPKNKLNNSSMWRLEYTIVISVCGGILLIFLLTALICWKRHSRIVHPPQSSVYSVQDGTWDSLSLHYIDNPAEFTKESWDEMSDDSYIASLDQAMARRMAPVTYYRNHAVLGNGPASFRHSTSSTVPIVEPNPDSV